MQNNNILKTPVTIQLSCHSGSKLEKLFCRHLMIGFTRHQRCSGTQIASTRLKKLCIRFLKVKNEKIFEIDAFLLYFQSNCNPYTDSFVFFFIINYQAYSSRHCYVCERTHCLPSRQHLFTTQTLFVVVDNTRNDLRFLCYNNNNFLNTSLITLIVNSGSSYQH